MSYYHEWVATQRQQEIEREARRRDGWNLDRGVLPAKGGLWQAFVRIVNERKAATVQTTPAAVIRIAPGNVDVPRKKAS